MTTLAPQRVILLPGLGADPRMFALQRGMIPGLETPAWVPHVDGESLESYAARFAATLDVREPVVLGGVSLGGMMALEMARVLPTKRVIMIASCRHPAATNRLLRCSEALSVLAPDFVIDKGRALAPIFLGRGPGGRSLSREHRELLVTMARDLPVKFLRWASKATVGWSGCADPGVPVHHIHGDQDWVIPLRGVKADCVVRGGIHVLNLSHPDEVNAFILEQVALQ